MRRNFYLVCCLYLFISGSEKPVPYRHFSIQNLAPGVWAAIQNDNGGFAIGNCGIVDLGTTTLVFDACINPDAGAELKRAAEQLTGHPVTLLVNSHYHDDHVRGDQEFLPQASIIATEWTRNEIEKVEPEAREWAKEHVADRLKNAEEVWHSSSPGEKEEARMWLGYYQAIAQSLPRLKLILPNITFTDSMWIHGTKKTVLLKECTDGHTHSDVVLILPQEGIAFMGDILFVNRHPWFGDGNPDSLKKHLQQFYADSSLKTFMPGHGPVAGKESLRQLIRYIDDLQQEAVKAVGKNIPDSVFLQDSVLPAYRSWWFQRFYSDNLQSVYTNAKQMK